MQHAPTVKRFMQAVAFNTVIALGISAFGKYTLVSNLVFSQCIGLSIWALIDVAQYKLIHQYDTQWPRLLWIVPACVVLGYGLGSTLASAMLPSHDSAGLFDEPAKLMGFLFVSLAAGGVITYFFLSREQLSAARLSLAQTQAQAEAAQRQAAESQLTLLQSQLEPHMLFNTLANLRVLIDHDPTRAQAMLDHLVAYLRATLNASRTLMHPLSVEFDRLRDYLALMQVRMGARLTCTLDLPPELADVPVPALLLQPLVENAIQHGLEPKVEGGTIAVRARLHGDRLTLEVLDTGVGLSPEREQTGFGLTQVRERLATLYGAHGTLELTPDRTGATVARVTFPQQRIAP